MSGSLHMFEFHIEPLSLVRFAQAQGHNRNDDEDLGYVTHAWFSAAFGDLSPKPFRVLAQGAAMGRARILAYSWHGRDMLVERLVSFAEPAAFSVCPPDRISAKPLPTAWMTGRTLGFEVLTCPVTRKDGAEKDVFLRRADRDGPEAALNRADVYRQWLVTQLEQSVQVLSVELAGFRLIRIHRRGDSGSRGGHIRPQALLTGRFRITDPDSFVALIARGVGRHRAFGYGMLLLRPA